MVKINSLEIENFKRVKLVRLDCSGKSLVVIGGRNGAGKSSVLDAIAYLLGGERFKPNVVTREGSLTSAHGKLVMSNGITVERKGKNSSLKVTDAKGNKGGQILLNEFVEMFALNLPRFMEGSASDKAETLLHIIGVGEALKVLEAEIKRLYDTRHTIGQVADQKKKFAEEMVSYPDAPEVPVTATELIQQQQAILVRNGENQRKRALVGELEREARGWDEAVNARTRRIAELEQQITEAKSRLDEAITEHHRTLEDLATARKTAEQLRDESTAEIEASLKQIDEINVKVRSNLDKAKASDDAEEYAKKYASLTEQLETKRREKRALLDGANLPLPGLSVEDGELTFNGKKWDGMSGAERLRVATAIVRKLNPECGFVLVDKLEQLDLDTLREFGVWAEREGLQIIGTRVSIGSENSIIIEDGMVVEPSKPKFTPGSF